MYLALCHFSKCSGQSAKQTVNQHTCWTICYYTNIKNLNMMIYWQSQQIKICKTFNIMFEYYWQSQQIKICRIFNIMFEPVIPITNVLVKQTKQQKYQRNFQTKKVLQSANYFLLKVDIKDEKLILIVMRGENLPSFVIG